jgi:stage II sporulation protein E
MQYGANLSAYERSVKQEKKEVKKTVNAHLVMKLLLYFVVSILISRVLLINYIAPFGIAFLIAVAIYREEKVPIAAGCGALVGYLTLYGSLKEMPSYLLLVGIITLSGYFLHNLQRKHQLLILFGMVIVEYIAYKLLITQLTIGVAVFTSLFETLIIFPLYFIINYSLICFKDLRSKHLFTNEELISMAITISLAISGTWGADILGVSIRNVLALTFVILISYIKGSTVGASCGVAMGFIAGICSSNLPVFMSVYGLCGLIAGAFKESGKIMTAISFLAGFFIVNIYSDMEGYFNFVEAIIPCAVFLMVPKKIYHKLALEFDFIKKQESISSGYVDKIKNILVNRLDNFSEVLTNMATILESLAENDKLLMKNKSTALIENLADRVCGNCNMNAICWKRENFYTYNAFGDLIENYQESKYELPHELERKCVKRTILLKNTEEIVNNYIISEMWRKRLSEGREILSSQISNMASSISEIIEEFNANIRIDVESETNIRRVLDKNRIKYADVFCLINKRDRLIVKIKMEACGARQICVKEMLPLISDVLHRNMSISDEGCSINPEDNHCTITYEETPKFHIGSHARRVCKDGESYSGDSYNFGRLADGSYMIILSDGMGSGPQAEQESNAAVELIEKFASTGFNRMTAINTVNSIMTLKFSAEEKFSTVDLGNIDLYTGETEFMKVGAVASFIKSGNKVEVIRSKTLPMGVLDKVDIDITKKKLKNGDIIVMLTDGMLDYSNEAAGRVDWVVDFLENTSCANPKELVDELIEKAKSLGSGKVKDDMTVIVSKVYSLY